MKIYIYVLTLIILSMIIGIANADTVTFDDSGGANNKYIYKAISSSRLKGDVSDDGRITVADSLLYLRYSIGQNISPYHIGATDDVTCDGAITVADALKVLRKSVDLNINLDCYPITQTVTGIHNVSYAKNYINWTWSDPTDSNFLKINIYIDGLFVESMNVGVGYYNATGFAPDTIHEIGTQTVDIYGNINPIWKNDTERTAKAIESIKPGLIKFITIGDPHLGEVPDGTQNLIAAVNFLKNRTNSFDLVVVVGDYHNITSAQNILGKIGKPYYLVKGNHDGLTSCSSSSFGDNVSNVRGYQLILVGICGNNPGQSILTKSYDKTIPTIVFTHLPSACLSSWGSYYKTGCGFVDTLGLTNLLGVYSGHVHEYSNQTINNTLYITEDNLGGNGPASDYIGYTVIQNRMVNYNRLYYR